MNNFFNNFLKLGFLLLVTFSFSAEGLCQVLKVQLVAGTMSPTSLSFDIYVSTDGPSSMKLAALTNVYEYDGGIPSSPTPVVSHTEGPVFAGLNNPTPGVNTADQRIRSVQNPVGEGSAITITSTPTLFGTMTVTTTGTFTYPIEITPVSTTPNPTMQGLVYLNGSGSSSGISVANNTIVVMTDPFTSGGSLPVELSYMSAHPKGKGNLIEWSTASEFNSQFHIVERSPDGISDWKEIGRVKANGTTTEMQAYQLVDERPFSMSYYRLKMLDFDGKFEYSNIVNVEREVDGFAVTGIFPLPADQQLTLRVASPDAASLTITVSDVVGRTRSMTEMEAHKGDNTLELDVSTLASGTYFVTFDNGLQQLTERIVKQ